MSWQTRPSLQAFEVAHGFVGQTVGGIHDPGGEGHAGAGSSGVLVEILASDGETEHVWQVATNHGCGRELWLTLARAALNPPEA